MLRFIEMRPGVCEALCAATRIASYGCRCLRCSLKVQGVTHRWPRSDFDEGNKIRTCGFQHLADNLIADLMISLLLTKNDPDSSSLQIKMSSIVQSFSFCKRWIAQETPPILNTAEQLSAIFEIMFIYHSRTSWEALKTAIFEKFEEMNSDTDLFRWFSIKTSLFCKGSWGCRWQHRILKTWT